MFAVRLGRRMPVVALLTTVSLRLFAHDLWIEPSNFVPRPGEIVALRLRVGTDLQGEALPYRAALVRQFVVDDALQRRPVSARNGGEPAGALRIAAPGLASVGYDSHPSRVELDPVKFDAYLREEGLDEIATLRSLLPASGSKVRELFSRCAKSLLWAGTPGDARGDRPFGCPLELVAQRNPYSSSNEAELPIRLTFQGEALPGALVVALNSLDPADKQMARTDSQGRVRFKLRPGGLWLVKAVHMERAVPESDADWRSYWASLTFGAVAVEP